MYQFLTQACLYISLFDLKKTGLCKRECKVKKLSWAKCGAMDK